MRQGKLTSTFFPMQIDYAVKTYSNINELLLKPTHNLLQPGKQTVIYVKLPV